MNSWRYKTEDVIEAQRLARLYDEPIVMFQYADGSTGYLTEKVYNESRAGKDYRVPSTFHPTASI